MAQPLVSIIVPHLQTPALAQLCLRSIRYWTHDVDYEVIVIDNGSTDGASLEYLRQVKWIKLIERTDNIGAVGVGHKEAIDIGIDAGAAPLILAFHTDTIPIREDWLSWHVAQIQTDDKIASVGTYKLEIKSPLQLWLKKLESLGPANDRRQANIGDHEPYIRSHCALYRRAALAALNLRYNDGENTAAGLQVHRALVAGGYECRLLDVAETLKRVVHLNHGTMALLPQLGARQRTIRKGRSRIDRFLARPAVQAVFNDASLDR